MEKYTSQVTYLHKLLAPEVNVDTFADCLDLKALNLTDRSQLYAPVNFTVQVSGGINAPAGAVRLDVPVRANPHWLSVMKNRFAKTTGLPAKDLDFRTVSGKSISTFDVDHLDRVGKLRLFVKDKQVLLPKMPPIPVEYSVTKIGNISAWFKHAMDDLPEILADELVHKNAVEVEQAVRGDGSIVRRIESHLKKSFPPEAGSWKDFCRIHHMNSPDVLSESDANEARKLAAKEVLGTVRQFVEAAALDINKHIATLETRKLARELKSKGQDAEHYKPVLGGISSSATTTMVGGGGATGLDMYRKLFADALSSPVLERDVVNIIYNKPIAAGCRWDKEPFTMNPDDAMPTRSLGVASDDDEDDTEGLVVRRASRHARRSPSPSRLATSEKKQASRGPSFSRSYRSLSAEDKDIFAGFVLSISELSGSAMPGSTDRDRLMEVTTGGEYLDPVLALKYGLPTDLSHEELIDLIVRLRGNPDAQAAGAFTAAPEASIPGISTERAARARSPSPQKDDLDRFLEEGKGGGGGDGGLSSSDEAKLQATREARRLVDELSEVQSTIGKFESVGSQQDVEKVYGVQAITRLRTALVKAGVAGDFSNAIFTDVERFQRALRAIGCILEANEAMILQKKKKSAAAKKVPSSVLRPKKMVVAPAKKGGAGDPPVLGLPGSKGAFDVIPAAQLDARTEEAKKLWYSRLSASEEEAKAFRAAFQLFGKHVVATLRKSTGDETADAVKDGKAFDALEKAWSPEWRTVVGLASPTATALFPLMGTLLLRIWLRTPSNSASVKEQVIARLAEMRRYPQPKREDFAVHAEKNLKKEAAVAQSESEQSTEMKKREAREAVALAAEKRRAEAAAAAASASTSGSDSDTAPSSPRVHDVVVAFTREQRQVQLADLVADNPVFANPETQKHLFALENAIVARNAALAATAFKVLSADVPRGFPVRKNVLKYFLDGFGVRYNDGTATADLETALKTRLDKYVPGLTPVGNESDSEDGTFEKSSSESESESEGSAEQEQEQDDEPEPELPPKKTSAPQTPPKKKEAAAAAPKKKTGGGPKQMSQQQAYDYYVAWVKDESYRDGAGDLLAEVLADVQLAGGRVDQDIDYVQSPDFQANMGTNATAIREMARVYTVVAVLYGVTQKELGETWDNMAADNGDAVDFPRFLQYLATRISDLQRAGVEPDISLIKAKMAAQVGVHHPWNALIHHTLEPVAGVYPPYFNVMLRNKQDVSKDAPYEGGNAAETYKAYHLFSGVPVAPLGVRVAPIEEKAMPLPLPPSSPKEVFVAAPQKTVARRPPTKAFNLQDHMRMKLVQEEQHHDEVEDEVVDAAIEDDFSGLPSCKSFQF